MKNTKNSKVETRKILLFLSYSSILIFTLLLLISSFTIAAPAGPNINYVSNTTLAPISANRSQDAKGTITTVTMTMNQQDYKWKAYVGNVSGGLALDSASGKSIYDWSMGTVTGEIYATRASSTVNWANVSCVNQTVIDSEQTVLGMTSSTVDSINSTFKYLSHDAFQVGTKSIANSTCRSTALFVNDLNQTINEAAHFQEVLLKDDITSSFIYTALIDNDQAGYDGVSTFDFQLIVAENESSTIPSTYFFYVELG